MILNDTEVNNRLESPLNLINRLNQLNKRTTGMELFGVNQKIRDNERSAGISTSDYDDPLDEIIPDSAEKIKLGIVKTKALDVLHDSLQSLHIRLPEIGKVKDLSTIAKDMNHILTAEDSKKSNNHSQVIIYKPIINELSKYETLVVNE